MNSAEALCGIDGLDKSAHEGLNHEWSPDGQLIPKKAAEESKPRRTPIAVDFLLRQTLIDLGIIKQEDLIITLEKINAERIRRDALGESDTGTDS